MATTQTVTLDSLIARYADDIAFVAEEQPASTADAFIDQLSAASSRLEEVGINGAEDLDTAANYLNDAANATGADVAAFLNRADELLNDLADMADEYRDMT